MKAVAIGVIALMVVGALGVPTLWANAQQQEEPKIVNVLERMISGLQKTIEVLEEKGVPETVIEFFQQALQRAQVALEKANSGDIEGARAGLKEASLDIWLGVQELKPHIINETMACERLLNFSYRLQSMTHMITNSTLREEVETRLEEIIAKLQSGCEGEELGQIGRELGRIGGLIHREAAKHRVVERVKEMFGDMTDEEALSIAFAMMPTHKVGEVMKHMAHKGYMFIRRTMALNETKKQEVYDRMLEKATGLLNHVKKDLAQLEDSVLKEKAEGLVSNAQGLIGEAMQEDDLGQAIPKLARAIGILMWAHRLVHHGLS